MTSWQVQDKETTQKVIRESFLQLCRIHIGIPGSFDVDGIICITRDSSGSLEQHVEEDQIVVKIHEQITTNVHENVCARPDSSILREYLCQSLPSRVVRKPAVVDPLLNLKRRACDVSDSTILDVSSISGNKNLMTSGKFLRYDDSKLQSDEVDRLTVGVHIGKVTAGNLPISVTENYCSESYSCGSCLLDFESWVSLQGHFQQSHSSCLEHYCFTCAIGFLSSADLGRHNSSVHNQTSSTASTCRRRKQNKPKRGFMNYEAYVASDSTEDDMEIWNSPELQQSDTTDSSLTLLLQRNPQMKMLHDDSMIVAKQEKCHDLNSNLADSEMISRCICPHCTSVFSDFSTLAVHCQAAHHRFSCPHCLQTFTQRVNRDRHLYNHTGEKPCECTVCGDGFSRQDALKKHQLKCSHPVSNHNALLTGKLWNGEEIDRSASFSSDDSKSDVNVNEECGLDLTVPSDLKSLTEEVKELNNELKNSVACADSESNVPKTFIQLLQSSAVVRHSSIPIVSKAWTDVELLACLPTSAPIDRSSEVASSVAHQPPVEGRLYSCDVCRTSVIGATAFEGHCRNVHRRTPCVYCGKTFSQKGNMERHQRQHTGERPFACPQCSCSYTRKETLKVHINQAHPCSGMPNADVEHKECTVEVD